MGDVSIAAARTVVEAAGAVIETATARLAHHASPTGGRPSLDRLDEHQLFAYDLAHAASAVEGCRVMLGYGERGDLEAHLACASIADVVADLTARTLGRSAEWGAAAALLAPTIPFLEAARAPAYLEALADRTALAADGPTTGPTSLGDDLELARDTFRRFGNDKIRPHAEHVHRTNADVPEDVIAGLAELGGFGLSVPAEHGGSATGGEDDYLATIIATEELSRASLGIGGSLITRPEILTRAIVRGGTDEQKQRWLPAIASGERMVGVMVTEPDFGSDVAGVVTAAVPTTDGSGYLVTGVKTWATFAGRADTLMLLARTDPDRSRTHRGLSLFVVDKPVAPGHAFAFTQAPGSPGHADGSTGRIEGRAIDTIGYRGMHSYEVSFDRWFVPAGNLVGGEAGVGKGFYLQMEGFENGRLQTAARAVGLMEAAFDAAARYAQERRVFGEPIARYQLTKVKLARMAFLIQAGRQFAYDVARRMETPEGTLGASMVKASVCRAAEWVAREAQQIHGGMGYAEEFAVSRLFLDARVLSIFEGADETLCLRVIARRLVENALDRAAAGA
jgi:(2S)-methylsuccinyl-CoA dehydrogenase